MTPTETVTAPEATEVVLPNRDQIAQRMRDEVAAGRTIQDMVRSDMLGIPEARILAAETTRISAPPTLDTIYSRSRAALPLSVDRGTHLSVAGKGGRAAILELLTPYFESNDYYGVVEISPAPGDTGLVENVPQGMLCVQFPETFSANSVRAYGHDYRMADTGLTARFEEAPRWTMVSLPTEANPNLTTPVAAVRDDGKSVVIFLSLFSTPSGQFVRTATNLGNAHDLFRIIMEACRPLLTGNWVRPVEDPMIEQIRAAVRTYETMRALASGSMARIENEAREARRNAERMERDIENYRQSLMDTLRDQQVVLQRAEVLSQGSEGRVLAGMTEAFEAMSMIEDHRGIANLEFVTRNNQPVMRITTKDFAFNSHERSNRRLCQGITFEVNMESTQAYNVITFPETDRRPLPAGQPALHPHISGANACWGAAQTALFDAIGRKDWVSAVSFVLGWMLQYNHGSPYTGRGLFESTQLPVGWIEA